MCQGSELTRFKNPCICEPKIDDKLLSKEKLLAHLKEYKKNLESELNTVNKNLTTTATAAEGGD